MTVESQPPLINRTAYPPIPRYFSNRQPTLSRVRQKNVRGERGEVYQSQKPETRTIEWDTKVMTEGSAEKNANTKSGLRPEIAISRRQ